MWIVLVGVAVVGVGAAAATVIRARGGGAPAKLADGQPFTVTGRVVPVGDLLTAPLSRKTCVHWQTTVRVPVKEDDATPSTMKLATAARVLGGGAVLGGPKVPFSSRHPMESHFKSEGSAFAIEVAQGKLLVDSEEAEVTGPALVIIPRKLDRERALLDDWGLAGTYATGRNASLARIPEPAFAEVVLEPGDRVEVGGTLEIRDGAMRVAGSVTLRLLR